MTALRPAAVLLALLLPVAAGCSREPEPAARLSVCVAPTATDRFDGQVRLEFRHGGTVLAGGSIAPGAVFSAPVPEAADIEVYADGKLIGSSKGTVYMRAEGCPTTPDGQ